MMRESTLMWIQYITGLGILVLGALHFASLTFLAPGGYTGALDYTTVISRYTDPLWAAALEAFLALLSYHVFNGFRIMLLELNQGSGWSKAVNVTMFLAALVVFLYGTRTIITFYLGGVV
ncbi:Succinate dehydrogenase hydrophobic membrane anchor protein [Conexivisphaera calida]|uniref:Succinate dehydrogenase hydrophobic membrane anchor protein n=2 Tax=Conexivisphaera calida TaxID=1874277 RepID=A0A4P2VKN0_9ARCH|nr:Succinate dehydrogenase hydrophobic membrane anchor protein [Conexivisphaera calida]